MAAVRLSAARLVLAGLQRQQRTVAAPPLRRPERRLLPPLTSSSSSAAVPSPDSSSSNGASTPASASSNGAGTAPGGAAPAAEASSGAGGLFGWLRAQRERSAALRVKLASLGLAAVLAYGELHGNKPGRMGSTDAPPCLLFAALQFASQRLQPCTRLLVTPGSCSCALAGLFDGLTYTVAFSLAFLGYEARYGVNPTTDMAAVAKICVLMCVAACVCGCVCGVCGWVGGWGGGGGARRGVHTCLPAFLGSSSRRATDRGPAHPAHLCVRTMPVGGPATT